MTIQDETNQLRYTELQRVENDIVEIRDPLYSYPHIESLLHFTNPVTAHHFADIVENWLPYEALKGTSHHGHAGTYYFEPRDLFAATLNYVSDDIHNGVDIGSLAQSTTTTTNEFLASYGTDIAELLDSSEANGLNVIEIIQAKFPHRLQEEPQLAITTANLLISERARRVSASKMLDLPEENTFTPHLVPESLSYKAELEIENYSELTELLDTDTNPYTKLYFGKLLERFALHMPIKTTSRGKDLNLEGVIKAMGRKIAEGMNMGEDMMQYSAQSLRDVETFLDRHPEFGIGFPHIKTVYSNQTEPGDRKKLQYSLYNYLLKDYLISSAQAELGVSTNQ